MSLDTAWEDQLEIQFQIIKGSILKEVEESQSDVAKKITQHQAFDNRLKELAVRTAGMERPEIEISNGSIMLTESKYVAGPKGTVEKTIDLTQKNYSTKHSIVLTLDGDNLVATVTRVEIIETKKSLQEPKYEANVWQWHTEYNKDDYRIIESTFEGSRDNVAELLTAEAGEVVFAASTTESNVTAIEKLIPSLYTIGEQQYLALLADEETLMDDWDAIRYTSAIRRLSVKEPEGKKAPEPIVDRLGITINTSNDPNDKYDFKAFREIACIDQHLGLSADRDMRTSTVARNTTDWVYTKSGEVNTKDPHYQLGETTVTSEEYAAGITEAEETARQSYQSRQSGSPLR